MVMTEALQCMESSRLSQHTLRLEPRFFPRREGVEVEVGESILWYEAAVHRALASPGGMMTQQAALVKALQRREGQDSGPSSGQAGRGGERW